MKLCNLAAGTNPRRVRIFLAEKKLQIPTVNIDMLKGENRTPEFLIKNPLGKLPALELDDGSTRNLHRASTLPANVIRWPTLPCNAL